MESEANFLHNDVKRTLTSMEQCYKSVQSGKDFRTGEKLTDAAIEKNIVEFETLKDQCNDQLHTYRASFRQGLTPQEKKAHNEKFSRFKSELANMKQEMKMLKQAFEYKSVKGPKVQTEDIKISGDKLLEETDKVVDEQQEIADRMIRVVEETKEVGLATLEQLDENTQQLNNIADTATGIRQDIKKANQLVNRYRRRLMTDRVIWVFTFLVFCAIVGIIVYSTVNPSQDTFMVPDVVKPPSANDVEQQVNNIASR